VAFNDLDTTEMVSLFSPYVNNPEAKKQFLLIKEIAGLHDQVTSAYQAVLAVRPADPTTDAELQRISTEQKPIDYRHDRLARVVALSLECQRERALAQTPPDEARAAACDSAFAAAFPEGTNIINASYRAEAGNTERLQKHLESAEGVVTKATLKSIPVQKGETLLDTVTAWIATGAELGALEAAKAARIAQLQSAPTAPTRVVQQARSQWITVASLLVQIAEVSSAAPEVKNAIVHPLIDAASKGGRRASRRGGNGAGAAAPGAKDAAPNGKNDPVDAQPTGV